MLDQKCYCFLDKHRNVLFLGQAWKYFCFLDKDRSICILDKQINSKSVHSCLNVFVFFTPLLENLWLKDGVEVIC